MAKKRFIVGALAAAIGLAAVVVGVSACEFLFNYDEITAPLSTVGEIGVRVQKTHNNCTLPSMEDYHFTWENIQVLGEIPWEEVGTNLYEKWFQVSLSQTGDGHLMISKDCTKEGYQEAVLPISVFAPDEEGLWQQAHAGAYPLEVPEGGDVETIFGDAAYADGVLTVGGVAVELVLAPGNFDDDLGEMRLFFMGLDTGEATLLLLVSEHQFLRFDHLIDAEP